MGFYYSATVGYGILLEEDSLPEFFNQFEDFYEDSDFAEWFFQQGYHGQIEFERIPNEPSGWLFFYVKDSYDTGEARGENGAAKLGEPTLDDSHALHSIANMIGADESVIGWHHIWSAN